MKVYVKEMCECGVIYSFEVTDENDKAIYEYMAQEGNDIWIDEESKDYIVYMTYFQCSKCYEKTIDFY